jgi:hypothetical protein
MLLDFKKRKFIEKINKTFILENIIKEPSLINIIEYGTYFKRWQKKIIREELEKKIIKEIFNYDYQNKITIK